MKNMSIAARVLGAVGGAALALWGAVMAANEVLLHGLSAGCSDGSPDWDPAFCGVTWGAGFPSLLAATVGVVLIAVSVWMRAFTRLLLLVVGGSAVLMAIFLLWIHTWDPVTPAYPEPAGPQVALLVLGALTTLVGVLLRPSSVQAHSPVHALTDR